MQALSRNGWRDGIAAQLAANRARFADSRLGALPRRWREPLREQWEGMTSASGEQAANLWLRRATEAYIAKDLPLSLTDWEVCEIAQRHAGRATSLNMRSAALTWELRRAELAGYVATTGIEPPGDDVGDKGAVLRMCDPMWWRRRLRAAVGREMEAEAIRLGRVHAAAECYASDETVQARAMQNKRNALALESTIATNENGDSYTLAELAAKGPANRSIRRGELMTRIKGFELIGSGMGSACWFLTLTCPSKYHARVQGAGRDCPENPRYCGATPREAQAYLCGVWARIRAAWKRQDVDVFGFRIAEPHHDGCPHWHLILWCGQDQSSAMLASFREHALREDGQEDGAQKYRVKVVRIEGEKGGAVAYVAKYVAKNIDGYAVGDDMLGNPAIESSARVEAWAARWGIRQFQQVGGPPVGVWRELRRIEADKLAGAPADLIEAHAAAQRDGARLADWSRYCRAQGMGRRFRVASAWSDAPGRYGEPVGDKAFGVTDGRAVWASTRHEWTISRNTSRAAGTRGDGAGRHPASGARRRAAGRPEPRTRVNNCTRAAETAARDEVMGALVEALKEGIAPRAVLIGAMWEREKRVREQRWTK